MSRASRVLSRLKSLIDLPVTLARTARDIEDAKFLLGLMNVERLRSVRVVTDLAQMEFGVYSQWGEDGIIEYLASSLGEIPQSFVEFGVEDYREANTRFLLRHRNWEGLVLDASAAGISFIQQDPISWRHDLKVKRLFITAENINEVIRENGLTGDIGLLSIDVDGNDYWIWKAIDVVAPWIVVSEYNSVFGATRAVSTPYDPRFERGRYHFSHLCYGASLEALKRLAREKGYVFVGTNSAGINAFFVRADVMTPELHRVAAQAHFTGSRVRESRDREGRLNFLSRDNRLAAVGECVVYDFQTATTRVLSDIP